MVVFFGEGKVLLKYLLIFSSEVCEKVLGYDKINKRGIYFSMIILVHLLMGLCPYLWGRGSVRCFFCSFCGIV